MPAIFQQSRLPRGDGEHKQSGNPKLRPMILGRDDLPVRVELGEI